MHQQRARPAVNEHPFRDRCALPVDVFVVLKPRVPGHAEFAMGAVASGRTLVLDDDVVRDLRIPLFAIGRVGERETRGLVRRERDDAVPLLRRGTGLLGLHPD